MLVLSRKVGEKIVIGKDITLTIVEVRGDKVRLGIAAPREIPVHRQEVVDAISAATKDESTQEASDHQSARPTC